ncbi:unnamed protein product [Symbiodinium necroappetens]|uniref:Dolichyl-diphosphooligosaccharide-protein glycosyltransferase subunit OST5 n=1 Tax=Symbiodinium necroappetens TaxID=1628268 RepID=A0A812PIE2_9DINO|nr:unnamed protein product [Symbiodinium necroappetens]
MTCVLQHQHSCAGRVFLESVHAELYSDLGLLLVFLGAVLAFQFLYYEVAMLKNPSGRSLGLQVFVALASSSFLGLGLFFLYAWAGLCPQSLLQQAWNLSHGSGWDFRDQRYS